MNPFRYGFLFMRLGVIAMAIVLCCAPLSMGQEKPARTDSPHLAETKARYDFANWPAGQARDGIPLDALRFSGYLWAPLQYTPGAPLVQPLGDATGKVRMELEIQVCDTCKEAREALAGYLSRISSAGNKPTLAGAGIRAGDLGYVGFSPQGRIAWILFVRGNVCVRLSLLEFGTDSQVHMRYVAERLDQWIASQPLVAKDGTVTRPEVAVFTARHATCKAGDVIPLDLEIQDPGGEAAALRWIVGGPGQGYVEQDAQGKWKLHTTKAGEIRLTCHVLGSRATTASRSLQVNVQPDR